MVPVPKKLLVEGGLDKSKYESPTKSEDKKNNSSIQPIAP
jgi:hypothetical protein